MNKNHDPKNGEFTSGSGGLAAGLAAEHAKRTGDTGPVKWDGPPVAAPSDRVADDWQTLWASKEFDTVKEPMRAGALDSQENGYAGAPDGKLTPADLGKEIVASAVHSPPTTEPLYRGIRVSPDVYQSLTSAKSIPMPLSAFTSDEAEARIRVGVFKDAGEQWRGFGTWKSGDAPKDSVPLLLRLEPGAKAAKLKGTEESDSSQREAVTFGTFDNVGLKPLRGFLGGTITQITLRQTSMREKNG